MKKISVALLFVLLTVIVGCQRSQIKEGAVVGKVTMDGSLLPASPPPCIYLEGDEVTPGGGIARLREDGTYILPKVRYGTYKVFFKAPPRRFGDPPVVLNIPEQYRDEKTTDLVVVVDKKRVVFDVNIPAK